MAHHSERPYSGTEPEFMNEETRRRFADLVKQAAEIEKVARDLGLGRTGQYPQGKLTAEDEGELKIAISHTQGKVILNFGKPTARIGFDPEQAEDVARILLMHAKKARKAGAIGD